MKQQLTKRIDPVLSLVNTRLDKTGFERLIFLPGGVLMARWLIVAGGFLILLGLVLHFAPWLLTWVGRLPGDIRFETDRTRVFVPITSMIIISVILTLVVNLLSRR